MITSLTRTARHRQFLWYFLSVKSKTSKAPLWLNSKILNSSPYFCLIHIIPCSCGSIMCVQRDELMRVTAFSVDISSDGNPSLFHYATWASSQINALSSWMWESTLIASVFIDNCVWSIQHTVKWLKYRPEVWLAWLGLNIAQLYTFIFSREFCNENIGSIIFNFQFYFLNFQFFLLTVVWKLCFYAQLLNCTRISLRIKNSFDYSKCLFLVWNFPSETLL